MNFPYESENYQRLDTNDQPNPKYSTNLFDDNQQSLFSDEQLKLDQKPSSCFDNIFNNTNVVNASCISLSSSLISKLPVEILMQIFLYIPFQDMLHKSSLVCRSWRKLAFAPPFGWSLKLKRRAPADICLDWLIQLPFLRILHCPGLINLSKVINNICAFDKLQCLDIGFCNLDDAGSEILALTAPQNLQHLNIEGCNFVKVNFIRMLVLRCPLIIALNLSHCINICNEAVDIISRGLVYLQYLNLDGIQFITDAGLQSLSNSPCIKRRLIRAIWLDGYELTSDGLSNFLDFLCEDTCSSDSSCKSALTFKNVGLGIFSLSFCDFLHEGFLRQLARISSLCEVSLRKGKLFSANSLLALFSPSSHLRPIQLTRLDLSECSSVNDDVVESVCLCYGATLRSLILNWCWKVSDIGLMRILEHCPRMINLSLEGNHTIYGEVFITLPERQPDLQILNLTQCNQVIDSVLLFIARKMSNLYIFDYFGGRVAGGPDDACHYNVMRALNKVQICEH